MQPKSLIKTLALIHASTCMAMVFVMVWVYIQNSSFSAHMPADNIYIYVIPVIAMIGYFGSKFVFQNSIRKIRVTESFSKKLHGYQIATIIKYALIEGPAFMALFGYFVSGNAMHLVIAITLIVYMFFQRPTLKKLSQELPLNLEEKKEFNTL